MAYRKSRRIEEREAIFSAFRYGSAPDAVLITYGIQGSGYWRAARGKSRAITVAGRGPIRGP